jgi:mutator family transposase
MVCRLGRSMIWFGRWVARAGSASRRCRGSARTSMTRSARFGDRSLADVAYPHVFVDATYCKARVNRRVVSQAVVIATGVTGDGAAKRWGSTSAIRRTGRSGPRSCAV